MPSKQYQKVLKYTNNVLKLPKRHVQKGDIDKVDMSMTMQSRGKVHWRSVVENIA